ncbi:MAG: efflux RND transporter periplasmic adaptor subunit [Aquificaceae bacterium]
MKFLFLLLLPLLSFSQMVKLDPEKEKRLGIKLWEVKEEEVMEELRLPAQASNRSNFVAQIHSPVSGIVKGLFVKQGDYVKKGQALASVYSPQVAELQAQIRMAKIRLKTAEETLKREEMLYKEEVVPYARYYGAKIEYEKAKGEYEALLMALRSFGEVRGDEVLIRSPIMGYVVEQAVFAGSGVDTSKEMFKIQSYEKLWVYAYADPKDVDRIRKGTRGYVFWKDKRLWGTVDYISGEVDKDTKRVPIRLLVENREELLRPGLMVDVYLQLGRTRGLWLPVQSLQRLGKDYVVFVKTKEGFEVRKVRKIKEVGDRVLVEGSIKEGEKVAMSGILFLKSQVER